MLITRKAPIYIYGYGTRGVRIRAKLQEQGLYVTGFIDRNAARYVNQIEDLPIYGLDDIDSVGIDFTQSVVFVAVTNVFEHEAIAKELNERGFKFIICKLFREDSLAVKCGEIYEKVVDVLGSFPIENMDVPMFQLEKPTNIFMEENSDIVTTVVPIDLLFGLTKELYYESLKDKSIDLIDKITDKSILYFNISKGLFQAFMSKHDERAFARYIQIYIKHRMAQTFDCVTKETFDEEEFKKHLDDRYRIYQTMEKIFSESMYFFDSNPPSVIWNPKGYFNIQDGNNRACFLLGKGVYEISCRMQRQDYEAWMNSNERIEKVKKALRTYGGEKRAPISHPQFRASITPYYRWSYQKLQYLCEWLWDMDIDITHANVLVIDCGDDLCGRHMARMGADVTFVETEDLVQLHRAVDDLLYIHGTKYVNQLDEALNQTYDLVLFTQKSIKEVTQNTGLKYIRGIGDICKGIKSSEEWTGDFGDKRYIEIAEQLCGSHIHSLICVEEIYESDEKLSTL